MKISLFTTNLFTPQNNNLQANAESSVAVASKGNNSYPNLAPLQSDTVSFGSAKFIVKSRGSSYRTKNFQTRTIRDALIEQYILDNPRLSRIATTYHALLQSVIGNTKGVFEISDNIEHLVKSPEAIVEKIIRSGNMKVPDTIRATAFCKNIYDMDNLLLLLDKMKDPCGYVVDKVPMKVADLMKRGYIPFDEERMVMKYLKSPKDKDVRQEVREFFKNNGYDVKEVRKLLDDLKKLDKEPTKEEFLEAFSQMQKQVPDIDIRLSPEKITPEHIKKLPEELRYFVSKPQSSGYEDIQIRFKRNYVADSKNDLPHELIIVFGKNYYDAKTRESHYIYSNLRRFKELTVQRYLSNPRYDAVTENIKACISSIEKMFRNEVSSKEFSNARNKDFVGNNLVDKIKFTEQDVKTLDDNMRTLMREIGKPYSAAMNRLAKNRRNPLKTSLRKDRDTLREIHEGLTDAINDYNSGKAYELTNPKKKKSKEINVIIED